MFNCLGLMLVIFSSILWGMEEESIGYGRQEIQRYCNTSKIQKNELETLGYDPHVRFVPNLQTNIKHQRLSLFVHGFGGSGDCVNDIQEYNPSDFVTFNLPDSGLREDLRAITKTSFGGKNENLALIYTLNKIKESGITAVDLVPISRGAATTVNTLADLIAPSASLDKSLQQLHITSNDRAQILIMIQQGTITLWWPLGDINKVIEKKVDDITDESLNTAFSMSSAFVPSSVLNVVDSFNLLWGWVPKLSKKIITASVTYSSMPLVTSYKPWQKNVSQSLEIIKNNKGFKIITQFQPNDLAVGNDNEGAYIDSMPAQPADNYVIPGIKGGHMTHDIFQDWGVNEFRKKYGSSYNTKISNNATDKILDRANVAKIVERYGSTQNFLDEYYKKAQTDQLLYWYSSN